MGGATGQLDLPYLTPLSVAGCGRLQLGAQHLATSVNYCKQLIIEPTFYGSRFSTGRLLAIEDFTIFYKYECVCRRGSVLVRHTGGRAFESRLVHQVLRFVGSVNTVQHVELKEYCT